MSAVTPNYLTIACGFCEWRETYRYFADTNPEQSCREILREHIATEHDPVALAIFDEHVKHFGLSEERNWTKAMRDAQRKTS